MTVEEKDSSKLLPTDPEWKWGPVRGDSQRETDIWVLYGDPQFSSVCLFTSKLKVENWENVCVSTHEIKAVELVLSSISTVLFSKHKIFMYL